VHLAIRHSSIKPPLSFNKKRNKNQFEYFDAKTSSNR
jgi:hypothetical protein